MCVCVGFVFAWRKMFTAAPILMENQTTDCKESEKHFEKYEITKYSPFYARYTSFIVHSNFVFLFLFFDSIASNFRKTQPSSWYSTFSQIQIFHTLNSTLDVCSFLFVHCTLKHTGLLGQYLISWQIDPLFFFNDVTISIQRRCINWRIFYLCMLRLKDVLFWNQQWCGYYYGYITLSNCVIIFNWRCEERNCVIL